MTRTLPVFGLVLLLYLALLLPALSRPGIYWDEEVDLGISRSYQAGTGDWFHGSSFDASQARLPMYLLALVHQLGGPGDLRAGRLLSVLMGALTLLAVYLFGCYEMDPWRGVLACLLLATSPFFLSFARIALTESGIFVCCAVAWILVCFAPLMRERNIGRCLVAALALGLAISCKFSALCLLPLGLLILIGKKSTPDLQDEPTGPRTRWLLLGGPALLLTLIAAAWLVSWRAGRTLPGAMVAGGWLILVALWVAIVATLIGRRAEKPGVVTAGLFVAGFAVATFMLFPPVHTTNPALLLELARRAVKGAPVHLAFMREAVVFYAGCVLFKSSPLIGAGMAVGAVVAASQWRTRPPVRLLLLVLLLYFAYLMKMPLAQTFYPMPLLPVLALLAADQLDRLHRIRPRTAVLLALVSFALLGADLVRCYPDYNLNGYQYLGARRLAGRSTLGYRGIVQVTTDGVQQALEWIRARAMAGQTVVTYIIAPHIVRALCPHPVFSLADGLTGPPELLHHADYVVIGINAEITDDHGPRPATGEIFRLPYDDAYLKEHFQQVFSVDRAFGLQVASVWRRRDGGRSTAGSVAPN
jgi:4-amino-4-deoxy-L-arabinose transferase-like glycosyltransferase